MDRKIRIHFLPRDTSRPRVISFSRPLGMALLLAVLPLCLLGFWLVLSGTLRESPSRKLERQRMEGENRSLRDKTAALQRDVAALRQSLDSLEAARIRAAQATGLAIPEPSRGAVHSRRFPFLRAGGETRASRNEALSRGLKTVRDAGLFFDSSLFVLSRNRELAELLPTAYPVDAGALVMRPYGHSPDPFTGRRSLHAGVDFTLHSGSPVYASGGGRVIAAGFDPLWGHFVRIRHTDRVETFYAHLQQAGVRSGETVSRGRVIGWVGQSGVTTGPHLHFEMVFQGERVDPLRYLLRREAGYGASPEI